MTDEERATAFLTNRVPRPRTMTANQHLTAEFAAVREPLETRIAEWQEEALQSECRAEALERRVAEQADLLEYAWSIIANAGGGNWHAESTDWQEAASRFRKDYFAAEVSPRATAIASARTDE